MPDSQAQFEEMVREHQAMVFRTLLRLTGDREQLEDLAQEVFLRLYRGLENFRGQAKVSTYLYRIIVNVAQDSWKRRQRDRARLASPFPDEDGSVEDWMESFAHPAPDAEHQLLQREFQASVDAGLLQLPEAERAVLVLYHQEECSYEAIAEALHLPIGTVRTHLHRGRKRLSEAVTRGTKQAKLKRGRGCGGKRGESAMKTNARVDERLEGEFEDTALTAALERRPAVSVPANFAARVMGRLPEAPRHRKQSRAGSRVGYISAGLVAGVLLLLVGANPAAFSAGKGFAFVFEMMLVAELMAVGCWLGTRRDA